MIIGDVLDKAIGSGSDLMELILGWPPLLERRGGGHPQVDLGERVEQRCIRFRQPQTDGVIVHGCHLLERAQHEGRPLRVVVWIEDVIEIGYDGLRVERGSIVESDITPKGERVFEPVFGYFPGLGQTGNEGAALGVLEHERVVNRAQGNAELERGVEVWIDSRRGEGQPVSDDPFGRRFRRGATDCQRAEDGRHDQARESERCFVHVPRARTIAPISPASSPSAAGTTLKFFRNAGCMMWARRARSMGSKSREPIVDTPPPITMTSGLNACTRLASSLPIISPASSITALASRSPLLAARPTASAVISAGGPLASIRLVRSPASMRSRALRAIAGPAASASRWPCWPQPHKAPPGLTSMCPSSPARPLAPRTSRPLAMTPPPMPVLIVRYSMSSDPRAAPYRPSARAATLASFPKMIGTLKCCWRSALRGMSNQPGTFGASKTTPSTGSSGPGTPTPIRRSWRSAGATCSMVWMMRWRTACGPSWVGVGIFV